MKIHDEGIIVGLKKYGERGIILNIFLYTFENKSKLKRVRSKCEVN